MLPKTVLDRALIKLPKALISVTGTDASKFLNGLLTIKPPDNPDSADPSGSYANILNSKGRVIADMTVYSVPNIPWMDTNAPAYLLEVDESIKTKILGQLSFYKLAAEVSIKETALQSWYFWNDETNELPTVPQSGFCVPDFRVGSLGYKIISNQPVSENSDSLDNYDLRRYLFGVPEGSLEFIPGKTMPLEFNLDFMHGVDFHKGCYVGQEQTIRAHHHGVVRKRVVPVVFTAAGGQLSENVYESIDFGVQPGERIIDESAVPNMELAQVNSSSPFGSAAKPRPSGSIVAAMGNVGLASLRIDKVGHKFKLASGTEVHPMMPFWWPEDIGPVN